ncbi:MAG: V-type ATP synthase subunit F [Firmicutes bacterium]|jgi:V/A-type H+-transporting ATPase subunit F|nr:V-type ATP synthase subunit F [Bacillota bacterium]
MSRVAVIGNRDAVLGFKTLGVSVFPVSTAEQAEKALEEASRLEFSVVFVTEPYASRLEPLIKSIKSRPSPVITVIPDNRGNSGLGMRRIKSQVEKAIGVDILFKEEGSNR